MYRTRKGGKGEEKMVMKNKKQKQTNSKWKIYQILGMAPRLLVRQKMGRSLGLGQGEEEETEEEGN